MTGDVIDLNHKRCPRCLRDLPRSEFKLNEYGQRLRGSVCAKCSTVSAVVETIIAGWADMRLRVAGAAALLRLGLPAAALLVLDGDPWPRLAEARAMQRKQARA